MAEHVCALCNRQGLTLTKHHLIPKEEGGTYSEISLLCIPCHKTIHSFYSNRELAIRLCTIPLLKSDPKIQKYIKWIQKQPLKSTIRIEKPKRRNKRL